MWTESLPYNSIQTDFIVVASVEDPAEGGRCVSERVFRCIREIVCICEQAYEAKY